MEGNSSKAGNKLKVMGTMIGWWQYNDDCGDKMLVIMLLAVVAIGMLALGDDNWRQILRLQCVSR